MGDSVARFAELISGARRVLLFTGAGISTASGIPDYRGPEGVWNTRRPIDYDEFLTSAEARRRTWRRTAEDRTELASARPNAAHLAAVDLERAGRLEMVVTQNIDGLHAAAGTSPDRLVEIHGTARLIECQRCGERTPPAGHLASFAGTGEPPRCGCGGHLKPATISFGQQLRSVDIGRAMAAADRADLAVALGSSLVVHPAAGIPLRAAERGVPYVVVNRGETDHDDHPLVTLRLDGDVTELFPDAVSRALTAGAAGGAVPPVDRPPVPGS